MAPCTQTKGVALGGVGNCSPTSTTSSLDESPTKKKDGHQDLPPLKQFGSFSPRSNEKELCVPTPKPFHQPYSPYNNNRFVPAQTGSFNSTVSAMSSSTPNKPGDGSVMTNGTFMVMSRPDGTRGCVKHPQLVLEGWTCPECEKEFTEGHNALQARKANLDNRLQALGEQQQQQQAPEASGAHNSPMGPMSVQQQQQQQAGLYGSPAMQPPGGGPPPMALGPYGTPAGMAQANVNPYGMNVNPMAALSSSLQAMSMNSSSGPPSASSSATSLETLALQINRMQQMQDWMLLQKEREVQMLRQELSESNQKLHTTQLEHALLKEKMAQQKIQHEQELKYLQLSAAQNFPPSVQNSESNNSPDDLPPLKDSKAAAPSSQTAMSNSIVSSNNNKDATSSKNTMNTGTATGTTNSTAPAGVRKQAPVTAANKSNNNTSNNNNNNGVPPTKVVTTNNNNNVKSNGISNAPNNNSSPSNATDNIISGIDNLITNNKAAAPVKDSPPKKTAPKKNPPEVTKKATSAMKQPPPPAATTPPNSSNNNNNTTNNQSKPSNNNDTNNNNTSSSNDNKPPPISHIKAPPPSLGKRDIGIPMDINVDDDAPPTVPLQEDITLGTLGKTQSWRTSVLERTTRNTSSDRFEPRYIGSPQDRNKNSNNATPADGGEGMDSSFPHMLPMGSDQQSLTVASSTYGEDRQKVVNQSLLDPYGDKGIYTGLILKSTGMPHGSGRMIYEEDQRIYEGEWRHGRWHGFGRAKFANGDSYEGEYRFDQRHGNGKYSWSDGRSYDGQFSEDRRHGKGLFVWPDGAIYEGQFANGQREGHGSYKFSDGGQYTGDWKDGRYNGFGTCSWEDGRCYRGEWRNGMAHGKGIETYADGSVRHDGQWVDDEPVR